MSDGKAFKQFADIYGYELEFFADDVDDLYNRYGW